MAELEEPRPPRKLSALNGAGSLKAPHSPLGPRPPPPGAAPPPLTLGALAQACQYRGSWDL